MQMPMMPSALAPSAWLMSCFGYPIWDLRVFFCLRVLSCLFWHEAIGLIITAQRTQNIVCHWRSDGNLCGRVLVGVIAVVVVLDFNSKRQNELSFMGIMSLGLIKPLLAVASAVDVFNETHAH